MPLLIFLFVSTNHFFNSFGVFGLLTEITFPLEKNASNYRNKVNARCQFEEA